MNCSWFALRLPDGSVALKSIELRAALLDAIYLVKAEGLAGLTAPRLADSKQR
jgi:hypothetical protein